MANDYFAAMQRVEQRLDIPPAQHENIEVIKVQDVFQLIQKLELPKLCFEERLGIACQLREALYAVNEHAPPQLFSRINIYPISLQQSLHLEHR